jgi:imidazoleglycerol-phosphate dehydratase
MPSRTASVTRNTKETQISLELGLDGQGKCKFDTGLPFFEHMLEQVARHGLFDIVVSAKGDLDIDGHHTVEDIGITLCACLCSAGRSTIAGRIGLLRTSWIVLAGKIPKIACW